MTVGRENALDFPVLRIDIVREGVETTARLSGDLVAGELVALDGFLARHGLPNAIGLWDVTSADAEGVAALRRLRAKGVTLLGPVLSSRSRSKRRSSGPENQKRDKEESA